MSGVSNFPVQIAPLSHVEKLAQTAHDQSSIAQQQASQDVVKTVKQQDSLVQQTNSSESGRKVRSRQKKQKKESQPEHFVPKEKLHALEGQAEDEVIEEQAINNVWAGNILNIKV